MTLAAKLRGTTYRAKHGPSETLFKGVLAVRTVCCRWPWPCTVFRCEKVTSGRLGGLGFIARGHVRVLLST